MHGQKKSYRMLFLTVEVDILSVHNLLSQCFVAGRGLVSLLKL
jgi:hypothetical protein